MAKLIEQPALSAGQMADDDVLYGGDMSATVGQRDRTFPLGALREYLGAGITVGVQQAAHGLTVGDVVRFDGTEYVQATADTAANSEAVGVVTATETDAFAYQTAGVVSTLSGLTPGELYYLQDNGSLGTSSGTVEKPILIATSSTSAVLILAITGEGGGGATAWGGITGNISDQTDLKNALDAKLEAGDELTDLAATGVTAGYVPKADGNGGIQWAAESGGGGGGIAPADGLVVVTHGSNASETRPTAAIVYWIGSVAPANRQTGDLWLEVP